MRSPNARTAKKILLDRAMSPFDRLALSSRLRTRTELSELTMVKRVPSVTMFAS